MRFSALSSLALLFLGAVAAQDDGSGGFAQDDGSGGVQMSLTDALLSQASAQDLVTPFPSTIQAPTPTFGGSAPVIVTGVAYSGSGCPHRTVQPALDMTQQVLTLTFLQYAIKLSATTRFNKVKKSCRIRYTLRSPTGYAFTNVAYGISGTYYLSDTGIMATARAALWLASDPRMKTFVSVPIMASGTNPTVSQTPIPLNVSPFNNQNTLLVSSDTVRNPAQLQNPWWSICPPRNRGPMTLQNMFERTAVILDTSMTLQRMSSASTGFVTVDTLGGTFQKGVLMTWENCKAVWDAMEENDF